MAQDKEKFLSRWSRLKHQANEPAADKADEKAEGEPPVLPPVESLTPESDFTGFMHPKVEATLRRVALKKLFSDPHFNVPDSFEPYSGDWTVGEPIPEEMLATLNQARTLVFKESEKTAESPQGEEAKETRDDDEAGRKDA